MTGQNMLEIPNAEIIISVQCKLKHQEIYKKEKNSFCVFEKFLKKIKWFTIFYLPQIKLIQTYMIVKGAITVNDDKWFGKKSCR